MKKSDDGKNYVFFSLIKLIVLFNKMTSFDEQTSFYHNFNYLPEHLIPQYLDAEILIKNNSG